MKDNPRITKKERGLIKGGLRRVFSRSELRREVVAAAMVEHHDPERPRVKKWARCQECKQLTPAYLLEVDHQNPIVPVSSSLDELDANTLVNNLWCDKINLRAICKDPCHKAKTKVETKQRAAARKAKKEQQNG